MEFEKVKSLLGIEDDVTTEDQFREAVTKRFVARATAFDDEEIRTKATGKITAITARKLANSFDVSEDEIKDKKIEDVIEYVATKQKSKYEQLETESKKGADQAVLDWQTKYEKAKKEANEYKSSVENFEKTLQQKETEFVSKEKGWKLNSVFSGAKEKLSSEFHGQVKELEIIGFEKKISDSYTFDIGENDEVLIYNKKDNTRVQDTNKMGSYISLETLLKNEANAFGLLKKNDGGGQGTKKNVFVPSDKKGQAQETEIINKNLSKAALARLAQG